MLAILYCTFITLTPKETMHTLQKSNRSFVLLRLRHTHPEAALQVGSTPPSMDEMKRSALTTKLIVKCVCSLTFSLVYNISQHLSLRKHDARDTHLPPFAL